MGILMSSMPIRILMGAITIALCLNGHYDYKMSNICPIFAEQNVNLWLQRKSTLNHGR